LQLDSVNIHPLSLYGKQELTYTVQYLFLRKKVMFGTTQMMTEFFPLMLIYATSGYFLTLLKAVLFFHVKVTLKENRAE